MSVLPAEAKYDVILTREYMLEQIRTIRFIRNEFTIPGVTMYENGKECLYYLAYPSEAEALKNGIDATKLLISNTKMKVKEIIKNFGLLEDYYLKNYYDINNP
jgi:hypothetical protein